MKMFIGKYDMSFGIFKIPVILSLYRDHTKRHLVLHAIAVELFRLALATAALLLFYFYN